MNKSDAQAFEQFELPADMYQYLEILLMQDRSCTGPGKHKIKNSDVLWYILKNTPGIAPSQDGQILMGATQVNIEKEFNINRFICKEILNLLIGATLVQCEEIRGGNYWTVTSRGVAAAKYIYFKYPPKDNE